jgi:hydroxyacyl-ACP dehydratase HTD2-like protein with hotdog domain
VHQFAATLDLDEQFTDSDLLPLLWHWAFFSNGHGQSNWVPMDTHATAISSHQFPTAAECSPAAA